MAKSVHAKNSFTLGELSPRCFGRFESQKPIFNNSAAILENVLMSQNGSVALRPGTKYIAATKNSSNKVRLERFVYSTVQEYILEVGNLYLRFFANGGQLVSGGNPVEITTPFVQADIFALQTANKADVMYIVHPNYYPQKLIRTSSTTFTISNVPFVRGPFLDDNITSTTITPSAATGTGITLTASSATFQAGHVGAFFRVNSSATVGAVVKITHFTSSTSVTADVQAEPDGTAGNIGGTGAYTNWAEGAFSSVRGYPAAITFHEGRLLYAGATGTSQTIYASVVGAYDNFDEGTALDSDAWTYEIASNIVSNIRWLDSDVSLKIGTSGGTITAKSLSGTGITPSAPPQIIVDSDYAVMYQQPERISGYLFYLQANTYQMRQLVYQLAIDRDTSEDMNIISDHILRDGLGAVEFARQQSPSDRLWVVRSDGQLSVFTRNAEQQVMGWTREIAGVSSGGNGVFESIAILPQDGSDDQIWVVVKRVINGVVKRYVEYFTSELFNYSWEPCPLDCSLSVDSSVTITGVTNASPGVVTAPSHGFSNGDQVKIDNIVGMTQLNGLHFLVANVATNTFTLLELDGITAIDTTLYDVYLSGGQVRKMFTTFSGLDHLNGEYVSIFADGGLTAAQQTFLVSGGSITIPNPAAVAHVGLPMRGFIQYLPMGDTATGTVGQTKSRKISQVVLRVFRSSGGNFGKDINSTFPIIYPNQIPNLNPPPSDILFTGDVEVDFESSYDKNWQPVIVLDKPLPFMLLASVFTSDIQDDRG